MTPRTDLVTLASLTAEHATLTAKNADLRGLVDGLTRALRELPPGDYPPNVQALWQVAHAHPRRTLDAPAERDPDRAALVATLDRLDTTTNTSARERIPALAAMVGAWLEIDDALRRSDAPAGMTVDEAIAAGFITVSIWADGTREYVPLRRDLA